MTDEEKKAIENLKTEYEKLIKEGNILFPLYKSDAKRLINLIKKQSKEIEELKEDNRKNSIVIIEYQDLYEKLVDKIKAKIEEINKEMLNEENSLELFYRKKYCKEVLQSLLERCR